MLIKSYESSASLLFTCIAWVEVAEFEMAIMLLVWFRDAVPVFMRIQSCSLYPPSLEMGRWHLLALFHIRRRKLKPICQCSTRVTLCHSAAEVSAMSAGEAFSANRINHFHCDLTKRRVFPFRHHSLNHCSLCSVLLFFVLFGFCCITTFHSVVNYSENID